jgi:nitrite reductase/ring-hydroxylating ferredoxin subunit
MYEDIGHIDEFRRGAPAVRTSNGREYAVLRWGDTAYVFRNICAHMGARLSDGWVGPNLTCQDPEAAVEADEDAPAIRCPWHGWTYDVRSGRSLFSADRFRLRTYACEVSEGGRIRVDFAS